MDFTPLSKLTKNQQPGQQQPQTGHITLINTLYSAKEILHITHNIQKSKDKSIHEAIGGLYTAFDDLMDKFVECIFGIYGPGPISISASNADDVVGFIKALYNQIESERVFFKESWIQNMIDMFQEEIALTLYKLQYVKSDPSV